MVARSSAISMDARKARVRRAGSSVKGSPPLDEISLFIARAHAGARTPYSRNARKKGARGGVRQASKTSGTTRAEGQGTQQRRGSSRDSGALTVGNPAIHDLRSGPEALRPRFTASLPNERQRVCSRRRRIEREECVARQLRVVVDKPIAKDNFKRTERLSTLTCGMACTLAGSYILGR